MIPVILVFVINPMSFVQEMDTDKDGVLSAAQVRKVITQAAKRYSHLREFAARLQKEHLMALRTGSAVPPPPSRTPWCNSPYL